MPRGVCANVIDRGDHIELASLVVRDDLRDAGYGTEAIKRIQRLGRVIKLEAVPFDGFKKRLHRFYRRMGFVTTRKGRRNYFEWKPNHPH